MQYSIDLHRKSQAQAKQIYRDIQQLIKPGITEKEAHQIINKFLFNHHLVERLWHPIVVKFDSSTAIDDIGYLPSEKTLKEIVSLDLGFVVNGIEVDYANTWLVTDNKELDNMINAAKKILLIASEKISSLTPDTLYSEIKRLSKQSGYQHTAKSAGHKIGLFPTRKSVTKIKKNDPATEFSSGGWMIEIHITNGSAGAFFEDLVFI